MLTNPQFKPPNHFATPSNLHDASPDLIDTSTDRFDAPTDAFDTSFTVAPPANTKLGVVMQ